MKLVLDTNVVIAALISHGMCHELLEHCAINHEVVLSPFILDEVREKLVRKFEFSLHEADDVVHLLKSRFEIVKPLKLGAPICRDRDDDTIIGTALAGHCTFIVTGDQDLLVLSTVQSIRMVTPADFWALENRDA